MKRCPKCNQTFEEDWLSFCTQDGTTLFDDQGMASEPLPTIVSPSPPVDQVAWNLPSPGTVSGPQVVTHRPAQPAWQPPPPPGYQSEGMATASMIIGFASIFCFGPIPGIVAIILGAMTLSQIKKNPEKVAGKQKAVTGIVTGSIALVIHSVIIIIYILTIVLTATNH